MALELRVVRAERIRTNKLGEVGGLVHGGRANRPHFVQHHRDTTACDLPGGFSTRQAAADDMDRREVGRWLGICHRLKLGAAPGSHNVGV